MLMVQPGLATEFRANGCRRGANQLLTGAVSKRDRPEGTFDNSPAFQRRVGREQRTSPEGTAEDMTNSAVPSGLCTVATRSRR